jgi:Aspartyl protease
MNRLFFSSCLLVILTLSHVDLGWSQPSVTPAAPAVPEAQSVAHVPVKLPIRLYWGYLVIVEGSIGNVHKLNFLVDTGAYPSVVDQKIARDLGLAEQPGRVNLSNTSVQTRLVVLPSLLLGPVHAEALPVLTEDLSFLQKALGHKVDAIVGLDVLGKSSFTINYRTKEMLLGAVERLTFSAPFDTDVPIVTIRTKFQDQQLRLVVDTGGPDLMLFQSRMPSSASFQELGTEKAADVSGSFQRRKVRIPEVFLGKETIGTQIASVVDDQKDAGDNFDGVLGMRGPKFSKIAFDFERRRFSWELTTVVSAITVAIYDDAHLSPHVLAEAQEETTRIYQKAGLTISWIECQVVENGCRTRFEMPPSATHLSLRIVPHASKSSDDIFGVAFLSAEGTGAYSDVSYDSVEKLDRDWHVGLARVLGHVIAHELGHLLLGSNAHSRQGIMCPNWHGGELRLASMGALLFSEEQAQFMRERLAR